MILSELKDCLAEVAELHLVLPDGAVVPAHFHITEAGLTTKHFVDCGGTVRTEKTMSLQVWVADDHEHRLSPDKLKNIVNVYEGLFGEDDLEVEVEYQSDTIGRYGLDFREGEFILIPKHTDCLARELCIAPQQKPKLRLSELESSYCEPNGLCC